jgi:hypothetical protein
MRWLQNLLRRLKQDALDRALESPTQIEFRYRSRAYRPDLVQVYWKGKPEKPFYEYQWIDSVDAHPQSRLGRLNQIFEMS